MEGHSDMVEPIHAESFFSVSTSGEVHERLCFEYDDPNGFYQRVLQDEGAFKLEIEKLSSNMQYYLDKERVEINGKRVTSEVHYTDIFLKGETHIVAVVYLIDFRGPFTPGTNKIETWLEEEKAPYPFEIVWRFPIGTRKIRIESLLEHEVYDDVVVLWADEGDSVGGYESMAFALPLARMR